MVVVFGVGHCGGCGFFFFGYDRCIKGLWVVVGLWLKWVVGRGSTSWVWISGLGSVDGGFEMVDLLIGGWIG